MSLKVALYARVSTSDQTIEPQILELTEYCRRQGWEAVGLWSDVLSGSKSERPGLRKMLDEITYLEADAVICVKLDRLGRSLTNVIQLVQRLAKLDIAVICTSQGIDTRLDNPAGRLMLSIMGAFAEFERDIIRERTIDGLKVARSKGKLLGKPSPFLRKDWEQIVNKYKAEPPDRRRSIRWLALELGGVDSATAKKLLNGYKPVTHQKPTTP
jgi:putative DNA-invertase from lambdoid prophage Rac